MIFPTFHPVHPTHPTHQHQPETEYQSAYLDNSRVDDHLKSNFDRLHSQSSLPQGIALISDNGAYYATLRDDGCLYVYVSNHFINSNIVWSSQSQNKGIGPFKLCMQDDGNLVIYDKFEKATWSSDSWHKGETPFRLVMESNGNLVIFNHQHKVVWQTNTAR